MASSISSEGTGHLHSAKVLSLFGPKHYFTHERRHSLVNATDGGSLHSLTLISLEQDSRSDSEQDSDSQKSQNTSTIT